MQNQIAKRPKNPMNRAIPPVPVDLFQVDAADLLADFPPPRSAAPAE
jgi:hypothetical protein